MATFSQFTYLKKALGTNTVLLALVWIGFFATTHSYAYSQICTLAESFPNLLPQIIQGCYWGILLIAFLWSFKSLPNPGVRTSLTIILFSCVVIIAQDVGMHGITQAQNWLTNRIEPGSATFWWLVFCYALVLAIPFMPGIELGLLLMLMFGEIGIFAAYGATVLGLFTPYVLGRALPRHIQSQLWSRRTISPDSFTNGDVARPFWGKLANNRGFKKILKNPAATLAIAFNLPCNSVIGGGGAIALLAGTQRFVTFRSYILIITVATLPVPLMAYAGIIQIESIVEGQQLIRATPICP